MIQNLRFFFYLKALECFSIKFYGISCSLTAYKIMPLGGTRRASRMAKLKQKYPYYGRLMQILIRNLRCGAFKRAALP